MRCIHDNARNVPDGAPMARRLLDPPGLGNPAAPFSHGVRSGDTIWVSAQVGVDANGRVIGGDAPEAQCRALFERIRAILAEGGAAPSDIVMVRGFLKDRSVLQATWNVRREFFGTHRPASTSFMVSDLEAEGALMSFEVVAVVDDPQPDAPGGGT